MKPGRNQQMDRIFQAALARDPADRGAFLDEACSGDSMLRREVEELLAATEQPKAFIESPARESEPGPAVDDRATTLVGRTIGAYRIEAQLGKGGMGEVYLARDSRLRRRVALKLLPSSFTGNEARLQRFAQEARTASALNHPNILTIYEIGKFKERHFIATEFVDGETLRQRMSDISLNSHEVLKIAEQIASALALTHEAGIVHRDIKPENIMVRRDGIVKVLDFGLAKLLHPQTANSEEATLAQFQTEPGIMIGTARYMSPEQVRGLAVDDRTDIWSLGVILYEMTFGRAPFEAPTTSDVIVAILDREPSLPPQTEVQVTPELERIIRKALRKDRDERYQTIKDLLVDLRSLEKQPGLAAGVDQNTPPASSKQTTDARSHGQLLAATAEKALSVRVASVLLVGLVVVAVYYLWNTGARWVNPPTRPTTPPQQHLISTFAGSHHAASFSPDGNMIAFVNAVDGVSQVWVKNLSQGEPAQITFGDDSAERPRWSSRGNQIVYVRRSQQAHNIWSVSPQGGEPRKLIEGGRNPNWSSDGARLVFERGYSIWTADADGGDQRKVEGIPPTDLLLADRMPALSPNGSLVAFFQKAKGPMGDYWVIPTAGGQARRLTSDDSLGGAPTWTPDGRFVVFPSQRAGSMTLWKVPVAGGEPQPVLLSAGEDTDPEISSDGRRLIYTNTRKSFTLMLTDPSSGRQRDLYQSRTYLVDPSFSVQGDKILFFGFAEGGGVHLYTANAEGENLTQLTRGSDQQNIHPQWSADGSSVYFYQQRPGTSFRKIVLRDGGVTELIQGWEWATHHGSKVDPSGRRLVYSRMDQGNQVATMIRDLETGRETTFRLLLRSPRWSPDGKFIVGVDQSSGSPGYITICPFEAGPCRKLAPGFYPHWSHDGSHLYFYRTGEFKDGKQLWSITSEGEYEKHIGDLRPMERIGEFFDVSPTGQVVWVRYQAGKQELWLSDFPGQ